MRLGGKVALVTGAASGLGLAIAQTFAREGAKVCVADVNAKAAEAAARELGGIAVIMDVSREDQVETGVARCARELGGVDVMVSNAGVQHIAPLTEFAYADWRRVVAIHLDGGFLLTRACLREMVRQKRGGTLLYMGSAHSKEASPLKAAYVAAKHGLLGLCRAAAKEGAQYGVRWSRAHDAMQWATLAFVRTVRPGLPRRVRHEGRRLCAPRAYSDRVRSAHRAVCSRARSLVPGGAGVGRNACGDLGVPPTP